MRFGKVDLINCEDKIINIEVNGKDTPLKMKLGYDGIAYFDNKVRWNENKENRNFVFKVINKYR